MPYFSTSFSARQRVFTGLWLRPVLFFIAFIWSTTALLAQTTTWTGAVNTNWATSGNWSAGVPTTAIDVVIPSAPTNQPVLSTTAVAKSVEVQSGSSLSITAAGSLTISGYNNGNRFSAGLYNGGTVYNEGQLVISTTASGGANGLWNRGMFTNNAAGVISINPQIDSGIYTPGLYISAIFNENGNFSNAGQIAIGNVSSVGSYGIDNLATFSNNTGGSITIDRVSLIGLLNENGSFTNAAQITIEAANAPGSIGIVNEATFSNNPGGDISIDWVAFSALYNSVGSFTNAAQITIGSTGPVGAYGLLNQTAFTNITGGTISIDQSSSSGLNNSRGSFTNEAQIIIGANSWMGNSGLRNQSTFNNAGCRALLIVNATISDAGSGTLTNSGTIIEQSYASSNITANSGLVRNLSGGSFTIITNTGVLTTAPGGAGTSITATPSLTINQGQSTTLTASGATSYTWSTGETTPTISVSVADTYSVTGTLGNCTSTTNVTVIIAPDLAPILYVRPTTLYSTTDVNVVVDVVELTGVPTSGPLVVRLTQDARLNLTYPPTATQINNRSVQNSSWTLSNSSVGYYTLTTNQPVAGGDKLSFGFTGSLVPGATSGSLTVSAVVIGGSGGDSRVNNNTDSDKIDYFQQ